MHRGIFLLCDCHSLSGEWERELCGGGRVNLATVRLIKLWRRGLLVGVGLWAPAAVGGTFCVPGWQRTGFGYSPFHAARIGLPCGEHCMATKVLLLPGNRKRHGALL